VSEPEFHRRVSELFVAVRRAAPSAREALLEQLAGDDARLRAEVRELLAHDAPGAADAAATTLTAGALPEQIGPYRVVRRVGRGGSGHVFEAEQLEPIQRRVAIKIVPQAAVDPELALRFEFERRALERTEHPNIARVLDAGRTADGLPYIVMDYVEGAPLTRSCEERRASLRERIDLVLQVASAIEHAHRRGVIHRDLKPANILVVDQDGRPTARVLDFGIAKPLAEAFGEDSPRTSGLPIGTPAYMAPEQTGLGEVDVRADVYALAAVLYELISGRTPLDTRGDPLSALQRIREEIPAPVRRGLDPARFAGAPATWLGDLEAVLAKALEKQPERRYATMHAFAEDLQRILRFEPIEARPPTFGYRAARFARRHRALVAAGVLSLIALAAGATGLTLGWVEAREQRREALEQSAAQTEIVRFLTDDLLAGASPDNRGPQASARELVDRASGLVEQRFDARPLTAAALHHTLGGAYVELGVYDEGERHLKRAIELRRAHAGPEAGDTLRSEYAAVVLRVRRGADDAAAEGELRALEARLRASLGDGDPLVYVAAADLGVVLTELGRHDEAIAQLMPAREQLRRLLGASTREMLISTAALASALDAKGDTRASLMMLEEALEIADSLGAPPRGVLLGLCNNIAAGYQDLGDNHTAAPYLRRAVELAREVLGDAHHDTHTIEGNLAGLEADIGDPLHAADLYRDLALRRREFSGRDDQDVLSACFGEFNALWKAKRHVEAAAGFEALIGRMETALAPGHWLTAQTRISLACAQRDAGRIADALPHAVRGLSELLAALGPDHARTQSAEKLVETLQGALAGR
jgi:tetratricopeptide (TPR) repeat protein